MDTGLGGGKVVQDSADGLKVVVLGSRVADEREDVWAGEDSSRVMLGLILAFCAFKMWYVADTEVYPPLDSASSYFFPRKAKLQHLAGYQGSVTPVGGSTHGLSSFC